MQFHVTLDNVKRVNAWSYLELGNTFIVEMSESSDQVVTANLTAEAARSLRNALTRALGEE